MVLSDLEILKRHDAGEIIIHPFNREDLGAASYDVRLGENFYEAAYEAGVGGGIFNIYGKYEVHRVWGNARTAARAFVLKRSWPKANWHNIDDDDLIVLLRSRANLLCHTQEFIGARANATTMMKARSSVGRSLVNVCSCAGMGDPGYVNRWTMEIYNRSKFDIPLVVGRRIAQIVFFDTGPTDKVYSGKYQDTLDIKTITDSWVPEMMLPRLYLDRDIVKSQSTSA